MVLYRDAFLADYHGNATSETDARRYRGASRRHHQTRKLHQGTSRHVHGHGDAGGKSGKIGDDASRCLLIYWLLPPLTLLRSRDTFILCFETFLLSPFRAR